MKDELTPRILYSLSQIISIRSWKNIGKFLAYIWAIDKINLIGNGLIRLISTFVPVVSLYVGKLIIDELVYGKDFDKILLFVIIEAVIVISTNALSRVSSYINQKLNYKFELQTTNRLIKQFNSLSMRQVENADIKNKFYLAKNESHDGSSLIDELLGTIESSFSIITLSVAVIVYNPIAVMAFIVTAFLIFISETRFYSFIYKLQREWIPERRKADYYYDLLTDDKNYKEIRLFQSLFFFSKLFFTKKREFQHRNLKIQKKRMMVNTFLYAINLVVYYCIYILFINDVILGLLTVGTLTYISGILLNLRNRINSFFNSVAWLNDRAAYLGDFFAFFALKPDMDDMEGHQVDENVTMEGLVFSHVGYKYENKDDWAVYDLNFRIKEGERVLIMGLNGSGKTTIIKLICKLYQPTIGNIYLNGRNIHTIDDREYYQKVNAIFQDYIRYEMTVSENIAVGDTSQLDNMAAIEQCAKESGINDLIERLPNKYQQQLGKYFKDGIQLSGGEWQKIAIARALYGKRSWLLLDEPSSALDILSERKLYQDLLNSQTCTKRTIIIVSHRLNNLQYIDHIIMLKKGVVVKNEELKEFPKYENYTDILLNAD